MKEQVITFIQLKLLRKEIINDSCDTNDLIQQVDASCHRVDLLQKVYYTCDTNDLVQPGHTNHVIDNSLFTNEKESLINSFEDGVFNQL